LELGVACNEAADPFEHSLGCLTMRKVAGIREDLVLSLGQHGENRIQVPFGSEFVVRTLEHKYRTGNTGNEISEGRFPIGKFSDTRNPGGEDRIRILMVLG
jgi:hypothetical protein